MTASELSPRKPTKKVIQFPENADGRAEAYDKEASEANPLATEPKGVKPAPKQAANQKGAATTEAAAAGPVTEVKPKRAKMEKVVRDSFTMPKSDYEKIGALKQKCLDAGVAVKKSELRRAGLLLPASAPYKRLLAAVSAVEPVKTGGPKKS
jgi:hypothetical protein